MDWANNLALAVCRKLEEKNYIDHSKAKILAYGYNAFLNTITGLLTALVAGLVFGCLPEALLYGICFTVLRINTGGFHFKSAFICFLFSTIVDFVAVYVISVAGRLAAPVLLAIFISSLLIIWFLAPVSTGNKALDEIEVKVYRKRARIIVTIYGLVALVLLIADMSSYLAAFMLVLAYTALLDIAGIASNEITRRRHRVHE